MINLHRLRLRLTDRLTTAWRRVGEMTERPATTVEMEPMRRRLQLLVTALYGEGIVIEAHPVAEREGRLRRLLQGPPPEALASSEGRVVRLPAELPIGGGDADALARYRVLAVEQAERIRRGTAAHAPPPEQPLARDLYLLREGLAVDAAIARRAPGLRDAIARARAEALASRPPLERLTAAEQAVERLVRQALAGDPVADAPAGAMTDDPAASLDWARREAESLRAAGPYRKVAPVAAWGEVPHQERPFEANPFVLRDNLLELMDSKAESDEASPDERTRRDDRDDARAAERARDSTPREDDASAAGDAEAATTGTGIVDGTLERPDPTAPALARYPEWDRVEGRHVRLAVVRHEPAEEADAAWADDVLAEHVGTVRRVRERFGRFEARRTRAFRQRDGDELDLDAVVRALAERHGGAAPDERLYVAVHPARRPIAIALLVDVSGSTEAAVDTRHEVIDVERIAVLLAGEALDALGDRWAALAFSGHGLSDVRVRTLKDFAERNGETVRRRIAGLRPAGFTRLGAAVRHAASLLAREPAGHRLLLILSDGRPNDVDHYQGDYAVEDARQAIHETRALGVFPFCLTVDAGEPEYLARIFGMAGHVILRNPGHLPDALLRVVKQLLAG